MSGAALFSRQLRPAALVTGWQGLQSIQRAQDRSMLMQKLRRREEREEESLQCSESASINVGVILSWLERR